MSELAQQYLKLLSAFVIEIQNIFHLFESTLHNFVAKFSVISYLMNNNNYGWNEVRWEC